VHHYPCSPACDREKNPEQLGAVIKVDEKEQAVYCQIDDEVDNKKTEEQSETTEKALVLTPIFSNL
jgi:hypothetical protein